MAQNLLNPKPSQKQPEGPLFYILRAFPGLAKAGILATEDQELKALNWSIPDPLMGTARYYCRYILSLLTSHLEAIVDKKTAKNLLFRGYYCRGD